MACRVRVIVAAVIVSFGCNGFALTAFGDASNRDQERPKIKKLGTIDCDLVEASPIVFQGRLYRFEYVRAQYKLNTTGASYFRFIDISTGEATPSFAAEIQLGNAFVDGDTVYVYGVKGWGTDSIYVFWSKDLKTWSSGTGLEQPGWGIYNSTVCRAGDRYIMAFEVGKPPEIVGRRFTSRFAESDDLVHWKLLSDSHVYTKERYSACPSLRYFDGWYYMTYLEARPGPPYETHIVRSKDLVDWQSSPLNPVLRHSPKDKQIANVKLTTAQRERIAGAKNINNSDVDFCEFEGKVIIYYSWGNQQGIEFLAEAVHDGSLKSFLKSFFPESK